MAKEKRKVVRIFEADEMELMAVNSRWTPEELLAQEGIFFLKDVVKILPLDPVKVKKKANEIRARQQEPWAVMGARKVWNHWIVRMKVFAPFYKLHLVSKVRKLEKDWNGNTLLEQKGLFYLTDVCKLIPFSTHQLRYQAKSTTDAKQKIGIFKDEEINSFVVDMEIFGLWVKRLWMGLPTEPRKRGKTGSRSKRKGAS